MDKALIVLGIILLIIALSGCTTQVPSTEQSCIASGGTVSTALCCKSASDFPNSCLIGACGCSPDNSHEIRVCDCGEAKCFNGTSCVYSVNSFEECAAAGYPVMESYPRQCRTPDGRTFVEDISGENVAEMCNSAGGHWNDCSSRCAIDNQGKENIMCPAVCEALCECGGIAGFSCPSGYYCKMPDGIADALGYCVSHDSYGPGIEESTEENSVGLANPAAEYCREQNLEYRIVEDESGGQRGECLTNEGVWVDEWVLYNQEITVAQPLNNS